MLKDSGLPVGVQEVILAVSSQRSASGRQPFAMGINRQDAAPGTNIPLDFPGNHS